ncbi:MAG: peptide deformylase [Candidatus Schekmanbacteria bacterium]|nr:peptide deformylase [Candidatus Schekmanbacteria bacterium]
MKIRLEDTAVLPIRILGDPVLREPAAQVDAITDEIISLAAAMFRTMYEAPGIGLAAPQVGVGLRLICVDAGAEAKLSDGLCVVNPRITAAAGEEAGEEGCLSIPGVTGMVMRATHVTVEGLTLDGEALRADFEGLPARIFQHEIDHLDGILFIDYLPRLKRDLIKRRFRKRTLSQAS